MRDCAAETQPYGIAKAQGRIEANQVDVSSKYAGQLADISVEEGSTVAIGQAIARISSPEIEAQLRAAQSDLQSAQGAFAAAEADIASRKAAFEFAKSDFERGQELMKTGFITKQLFEERQRNFEAAQAAVETMSARRDQAQASIAAAEAKVQQINSMIQDLTLVSPRNGKVQYQLARKGETVAAGEPIVTILDLTDLRMIIFLPAADAGRLGVGGEARVVLDAVPDYVIPAEVSFVASESQFTPKTVETKDERAKLMFRVELRIDRQVLKTYYGRVEGGLIGFGFVRTRPDAKWPAELEVKLPPAPASPPIAETPAPAAAAPTPTPVARVAPPAAVPAPASAPAPHAIPPAPAPVAPVPAPVAQAAPSVAPVAPAPAVPPSVAQTAPSVAPVAPAPAVPPSVAQTAPPTAAPAQAVAAVPAPVAQTAAPAAAPTPPPPPAPAAQAAPPATAPAPAASPPAAASAAAAEEQGSEPDAQEPPPEFAPQSVARLVGAWASSAGDCGRLFQRRGEALAFRQPVDRFAQAAIVEPQRIRLPSAICLLETATKQGGALKLSADCQDSISYTSRTVYITLRSDTELFYSATGDPVLATTLMKCPL